MEEGKKKSVFQKPKGAKFSLAGQVMIFFLLATIITAFISYFILKHSADQRVRNQKADLAEEIAEDLVTTVRGYPAYEWLLEYWFNHTDSLDLEYNSTYQSLAKEKDLTTRHPGFIVNKAWEEEIRELSPDDQKMYAEIVYNHLITLLNSLKEIYKPTYIYILVMDKSYTNGTFLLSGADKDQKRGTNYGEAYVLGVKAKSTLSQKLSMLLAASKNRNLAQEGDYVDRYGYIQDIMGDYHVMVGVTYDLSGVIMEVNSQVLSGMMSFIIMQALLAVACLILIYFSTLLPLERIQKNVRVYREKKDSETVLKDLKKVRSQNELGTLSSDISDMVVSIDRYVDEIQTITSERERIAAELSVATTIQASALPRKFPAFPGRHEFDLYATMTPAKEVGGDFYDFFLVDDNHLVLVVADVSGKGIPAALFMMNSKTRIKNQALLGGTPKSILEDVNNELCEENASGFFVTVWIAIIDLNTGKGIAANAGHEHPVIRRAGGEYETVKYRHSPAVATVDGIPFREHEFEMHPGDRLFVYTDGVPEATNGQNELFGEERMLKSLNSHPEDTLQELLPDVKKDIDTFVGDAVQFDDITMLGFDYYGPEGKQE